MANETERTVTFTRFQQVTQKNKELSDRVKDLEGQLVGAWTADKVEELKTNHKAEVSALREEGALVAAGITDPLGQKIARLAWDALPAEGKPSTLGDYVASLKVEGAVVPPGLAAYMPAKAATTTTATQTTTQTAQTAATQTTASRLPPTTQAVPPPATTGKVTPAMIATITSSPEYRALTKEQKATRLNELQAQARATAAPAV